MQPSEIRFVSQRIAANALARGERSRDEIVEKILVDVPEAKEAEIREMVVLLESIQEEMKIEIPKIRKKTGDAAYPDLERWKVDTMLARIMSTHGSIDKEALESLLFWTDYYHFLR